MTDHFVQIKEAGKVDPLYFSMSKMLTKHVAAIAKQEIIYAGEVVPVKPLIISALIFQPYSCPSGCGACCVRATLDYIPGEAKPKEATDQYISINGKEFIFYSDVQLDHDNARCRNLTIPDARCSIYPIRPFSCDFAVMNVNEFKTHRILLQRKFGRYWHMTQIDGTKGTQCEKIPLTMEDVATVHRRLLRLIEWANYFEIANWGTEIKQWLSGIDSEKPIAGLRLGF